MSYALSFYISIHSGSTRNSYLLFYCIGIPWICFVRLRFVFIDMLIMSAQGRKKKYGVHLSSGQVIRQETVAAGISARVIVWANGGDICFTFSRGLRCCFSCKPEFLKHCAPACWCSVVQILTLAPHCLNLLFIWLLL